MDTLRNKTALVTGASRGIGRATASALAEAGAHVLVHYGRSMQDAESLVADIRSKEGRADAVRADLGTPEGATLLAKEVRSIVGERLDVDCPQLSGAVQARWGGWTPFTFLPDPNCKKSFSNLKNPRREP